VGPCLGLIVFFGGITPFFWHSVCGPAELWTIDQSSQKVALASDVRDRNIGMVIQTGVLDWFILQLGAWTNYTPFVVVGGFLLLETVSDAMIRWAVLAVSCFMSAVSVGCTVGVVSVLTKSLRVDVFCLGQVCMYGGFAVINGRAACKLLSLAVRPRTPPRAIYTAVHVQSRVVLCASGQLLVLAIWGMFIWDADLALHHPYGPGSAMTATVWSLAGFCLFRSQENSSRFVDFGDDGAEEMRLLASPESH